MKKTFALLLSLLMLLLCFGTAFAAEQSSVVDLALLLTDDEWQELSRQAQETAEGGCGVYIILLEDYRDYAGSPRDCAEKLFLDSGWGVGAEADGVLLLLSMDDRDYSVVGHGSFGRTVVARINDDAFLDDFADNDWYGGLADYIDECADAIAMGPERYTEPPAVIMPEPMPVSKLDGQSFLYIVLGSCAVSAIICLILLARMKTARRQTAADAYVPEQGVKMRISTDRYTHTTRSVRHAPRNNSSGGGSGGGGGGFSGRSGKF